MENFQDLDRFDGTLPIQRASMLPSSWYFSRRVHELERERVFAKSWQLVGRLDQVTKPGNYLTADVAGEPVVVCRDKDGVLRAFSNVCRHKAAKVVCAKEGHASFFQCRYHGWTYDLAGRLKGTPECDGIQDFSKDNYGLPSWEVATMGPFVFVHFGKSASTLGEFLDPFPQMTAEFGLEKLHFVGRSEYIIQCNWKVFVDNYLDGGYHINTVHPGLAGVVDYAKYRTEVFSNSSVQISPLVSDGTQVSTVRSGQCAYYWWVYPNLMINIYDGVMDTNLVLPLGPDKCVVYFDFYFSNKEGKEAQAYIERSKQVADQVQQEDLTICEDVQRGMNSQTFSTGRFNPKREMGAYAFHQSLFKAVAPSLSGD